MKRTIRNTVNCIGMVFLLAVLAISARATTIKDVEDNINRDQRELDGINDSIMDLQDEQDLLEEEISDLNSELLNTMTSIGLLEDDIAAKEADIETTQSLYDEAKAVEEQQYAAMVTRIQMIYEAGDTDYLSLLLSAGSLSEMLNQASYIEAIFDYDQRMLTEYEAAKEQVKALWDQLEAEKAGREQDRADMQEQQAYLDGLLARKKEESASYDAQIARAKQEASALKVKIKQEQAELKKLQDEERKKNAAKGTYTVGANIADIINNASGSDLGKQIARYGCQFIGNPYVYGGTSLTNGTDCSGFTYKVYQNFGYNLPRTSYAQRSAGKEVSYSEAQPGDLICYDGHIGIYIGGGYIVHASSVKTGIKVSKATYRTILSVRRIL